jgi:hypothetical protein
MQLLPAANPCCHGMIRVGNSTMRKDFSTGRWLVRRVADEMVWPGSSGIERIRQKLWRRRAAGEPQLPVVIGNCGRPADQECGLKDPRECAVHAGGWDGLDGGTGDWDGREASASSHRAR